MNDIWFISDTHLGHANILKFKRDDGTPLRSFASVREMNECIFDRWASVVKPGDKVYHLGDVAFDKHDLEQVAKLPGHKRLIRGNHDGFKLNSYHKVFQEVYGVRQFDGFWMSHVPMHTQSLSRAKLNIHGHLHANKVVHYPEDFDVDQDIYPDRRYYNVCVEHTDYTPVNFETIKAHWKNNFGAYEF